MIIVDHHLFFHGESVNHLLESGVVDYGLDFAVLPMLMTDYVNRLVATGLLPPLRLVDAGACDILDRFGL